MICSITSSSKPCFDLVLPGPSSSLRLLRLLSSHPAFLDLVPNTDETTIYNTPHYLANQCLSPVSLQRQRRNQPSSSSSSSSFHPTTPNDAPRAPG